MGKNFNDDSEDRTQLGAYGKDDHRYMQSLSSAVVQRSPRHLMMVILIMALFVLGALIWMNWAKIDVVIRGSGKVIPASQVQLVQSLEGGIVSEILVKEGQLVELGQPLVKISDVAFSSSFEENNLSYLELLARASRLKAEGFDEEFQPNADVSEQSPLVNAAEQNLLESNRQQLSETLSILDEQVRQQQSALDEAQSKQRQLQKTLGLVRKEIDIKRPLKERGIISEVEFLQLQQREAEIEGELEAVKFSIPRFQSTIEETRFKKERESLDFRNQAKKELNEVNAEIARIRESQTALQDRVTRTTLRSPVKGIVKQLYTNTVGGVVSPGSQVVDIVPQEDSLLVELQIKPADIASVTNGQNARLKFSAYDFALYGSLEGDVSFVSADTITDEEGNSYYLVRVKPTADYLGHESNPLYIKVGMTAEADIITSKKTILSYLMEPVNRGLDKALRER
jgi:adhesin transport system membrane fusion protein